MSTIALNVAKLHTNKINSSTQKHLLQFLSLRSNEHLEFWWSKDRIAKELCMNIKTVYKNFKEFIKKGIIEFCDRWVGKYKRIRVYRIVDPLNRIRLSEKETVQYLILPKTGVFDDSYQYIEKKEKTGGNASSEISVLPKTAPNNFSDLPRREQEMKVTENPYEVPPPIQEHDVIKLNKTAFDEKFGKKQITIDQLYDAYNKHFQGRVSVQGFRKWIENEHLSRHKDKPSARFAQPKAFAKEELPTQEEWDHRKSVAAPHLQALKNLLGIFRR